MALAMTSSIFCKVRWTVWLKFSVFLLAAPCLIYSSSVNKEAIRFSETSVSFCQTTRYHILWDSNLHLALALAPEVTPLSFLRNLIYVKRLLFLLAFLFPLTQVSRPNHKLGLAVIFYRHNRTAFLTLFKIFHIPFKPRFFSVFLQLIRLFSLKAYNSEYFATNKANVL
jgi:hypothetical protein